MKRKKRKRVHNDIIESDEDFEWIWIEKKNVNTTRPTCIVSSGKQSQTLPVIEMANKRNHVKQMGEMARGKFWSTGLTASLGKLKKMSSKTRKGKRNTSNATNSSNNSESPIKDASSCDMDTLNRSDSSDSDSSDDSDSSSSSDSSNSTSSCNSSDSSNDSDFSSNSNSSDSFEFSDSSDSSCYVPPRKISRRSGSNCESHNTKPFSSSKITHKGSVSKLLARKFNRSSLRRATLFSGR